MSNFFAQTEALMHGKSATQVQQNLIFKESQLRKQNFYCRKIFSGNKPTNTILIQKLTQIL
jgi:glucose-6-phosphate isomerase